MKKIDNFINMYPITKTLRFKLVPVGKTKENFDKEKLLDADKERADNYRKAKVIIDKYYNEFINNCLNNFHFKSNPDNLRGYYEIICNSELEKKEKISRIKEIQVKLRKEIVDAFNDTEIKKNIYDILFTGNLLNEILEDNRISDEEKEIISKFDRFTTYFQGFFQNRKNLFSNEEKVGSIAYRCVNENLKTFVNNIRAYNDKIKDALKRDIKILEKEYKDILKDFKTDDIFNIDYYNLCLTGDDINKYNKIIGGFSKDEKPKIKGLNEYINLYNQTNKDKTKLPKLKQLYKQILSDDKNETFRFDVIEDDKTVYDLIDGLLIDLDTKEKNVLDKVSGVFKGLLNGEYDYEKIYIVSKMFTELSVKCFDNFNAINQGIENEYDNNHKIGKNKEKYESDKDKYIKSIKYLSIGKICYLVESIGYDKNGILKEICEEIDNIINSINDAVIEYNSINKGNNIRNDEKIIKIIKNLLDSLLGFYRYKEEFFKYDETEKIDLTFYGELGELDFLNNIVSIYNKVRNYLTKKPYKTDKIKLNFNKANLLNGWVDSKTDKSDNGTQYSGYLFRKKNCINEYDYYLGVSEDVKLFRNDTKVDINDVSKFERLNYYQLKGDTIYGQAFSVKNDKERFDNLKNILLNNKRISAKNYVDIENSKNLNELKSVADNILKNKVFNYFTISQSELENAINREQKPLYLFKISNKDLSYADKCDIRKSRGIDNLHTMYFKMLMSDNQENFDLGSGEIFLREATPKGKMYIVHKAKELIENKSNNYNKKSSLFQYDIIKDKRFYEEQFMFHLSTKINYKSDEKIKNKDFNIKVNETIKKCDDNYVIGIDRGERNLIYVSVVSEKNGLVEQMSLNDIVNEYNGNVYNTDYHELLDEREKERDNAKKSWKSISTIKELKEGYVSQVVHKICELVEKYDAIIVMEDLNAGFKNSRIKVEKQVYQKFEKMLIDKLNLYINKKYKNDENGGLLKGYQLTRPYESNNKMAFQNGFIFYVAPWNTSKIDPTTGFVNLFRLSNYTTSESRKAFISKFDSIKYNKTNKTFEFIFNYKNFDYGATDFNNTWSIASHGKRILTLNKDKISNYDYKEIDLTEELINLFVKYRVPYEDIDIKESILKVDENDFYDKLFGILKLILQIRNSKPKLSKDDKVVDYMSSPVKNKSGQYYNSNEVKKGEKLPIDADANGAYNIARKGLMIVERIKNGQNDKLTVISNKEWLEYAQTHLPI